MKLKKIITAILLSSMVLSACSQATVTDETSSGDTQASGNSAEAGNEVVEAEEEVIEAPDIADDVQFDGASFCFGVIDNPNARNLIVEEEITGEVLNDAKYNTIQLTQDRLNVTISENVITTSYPGANAIIPFINAGDDVIQVANMYCVDVVTLINSAYIRDYKDIPYINLDKPYWDKSVNNSLTFGDMRYGAIGDLSISTSDLTFCLLFNDYMIDNYGLENLYSIVFEGKWTMDKMDEMMKAVLTDVNGDGARDDDDIYGYLSHHKNVLPSFWVATGETTVGFDTNKNLTLTMSGERFYNVIQKIFEITYDNECWYRVSNEDQDVPAMNTKMFSQDQALFMDNTFFWVSTLRDMEHDFGIIPYPKFDETQDTYHARVSYYMPPVLPVTSVNTELVGAVLEYANYYAKLNITPAYYETTLKGKYARDKESIEMLDLMFANRIVDLGDSLFCSNIRDSFIASMFDNNNRDMASTVKKNEKILAKTFSKIDEKVAEVYSK